MIHVYDAWLKKVALHNSHILPPFLNICPFRDFRWTTTYRCIQTYFRVQIHSFCSVCSHLLKSLERQIFRNGESIIKECCTTSLCNCCLASNINLVLLGTYVIGKDPRFNPFCVWGNEISMNQHQVRKLIKIASKMGPKMAIKLFVYTFSKTTMNCMMVSKNSAAFF